MYNGSSDRHREIKTQNLGCHGVNPNMKFAALIFSLAPVAFVTSSQIPAKIVSYFKTSLLCDDFEVIDELVKEYPSLVSVTSFLDACRHKRENVVDVLCNNLKANPACSIGSLFLTLVKEREDPLIYFSLLRIAGHWRNREQDGRFPLITAAEIGGIRLVSDLLHIPWISDCINLQDDEGNTALHYAAKSQTVQLLLDSGSDWTIKNLNQETCLHTTASFMEPYSSYVEKHKSENWPSSLEFMSHYSELKRFFMVLKAFVLRGLDPYDMTEHHVNIFDMVLPEFHAGLIEALEMRVQVDSEIATIEAELELGPNSSFLAWLPSPDLSGLIISYIKDPLEDLIAFNLRSL